VFASGGQAIGKSAKDRIEPQRDDCRHVERFAQSRVKAEMNCRRVGERRFL